MKISEFSAVTGLSPHTLRYYEKIGLITNVKRDPAGIRSYRSADAEWIEWIACLKTAGMTIKTIKQYSRLRDVGNTAARAALLEEHVHATEKRLREMESNLAVSRRKLAGLLKHLT